jgi:hypothetical protein
MAARAWLEGSRYAPHELYLVLCALVASTLVGLAAAHALLLRGELPDLQLNSVGHVNHTAIYLAIMLGVCAAWLFATWPAWPLSRRVVALSITLLVLVRSSPPRAAAVSAVLVLLALRQAGGRAGARRSSRASSRSRSCRRLFVVGR